MISFGNKLDFAITLDPCFTPTDSKKWGWIVIWFGGIQYGYDQQLGCTPDLAGFWELLKDKFSKSKSNPSWDFSGKCPGYIVDTLYRESLKPRPILGDYRFNLGCEGFDQFEAVAYRDAKTNLFSICWRLDPSMVLAMPSYPPGFHQVSCAYPVLEAVVSEFEAWGSANLS
jgi:hypothetical protein